MARSFNGTTDHAEITVNLSGSSVITVAFWFKMATIYNNTLHTVFEYTNPVWTSGGFVFIPASAANKGVVGISNAAATAQWIDIFDNTGSGTNWTHYVVVYNRATPALQVWRNGSKVTMTTSTHTAAAYGNFANSTLNVCSGNAGAARLHDGTIAELAIWDGDQSGHATAAGAVASNALPQSLLSGVPAPLASSVQPLLYVPWLGFDSPEPDYSGAKHSAVLTGTSRARHPSTRTLLMPGPGASG